MHAYLLLHLLLLHIIYYLLFLYCIFIIAYLLLNLRGVSTKLNKYIVFTMQTYKKLITCSCKVRFEKSSMSV